jgi:hypothetical protein
MSENIGLDLYSEQGDYLERVWGAPRVAPSGGYVGFVVTPAVARRIIDVLATIADPPELATDERIQLYRQGYRDGWHDAKG